MTLAVRVVVAAVIGYAILAGYQLTHPPSTDQLPQKVNISPQTPGTPGFGFGGYETPKPQLPS